MTVLTKISTKQSVEFFIFGEGQEREFLLSLCGYCHSEDCNDDCILTVPGAVECDGCDGAGLIKFFMKPSDGGESYFVITECGYCNGIGLV